MIKETNLNELSAVAARRLGLSNQTTQATPTQTTPNQSTTNSNEQDFHSINLNPSTSDQETDHEENHHNEIEPESEKRKPKKSRYFTNPSDSPSTNQTPVSKHSIHLPSPSSTSKLRTNHHQLKRRKTKVTFSDPDCVSNWEPKWMGDDKNVMLEKNNGNDQSIIIGINLGENLIFRGTLLLSVLMGTIEINGARIEAGKMNEPLEVFAPMSHPLPIITILNSSTSSRSTTTETELNGSNFDAILRIQDFHTGIEGIDLVWSSNGPKRAIWNQQHSESSIYGITWDLILTLTPELSSIKLPITWSSSLSNPPTPKPTNNECYLVQGPKGVGKSTFVRLLLNKLLQTFSQVAVLDVDPGQPLFTPPSIISLNLINKPLIGPSFCLQSIPQSSLRSHYLGNISPIDAPSRYIESLEDLINLYKFEFNEIDDQEPVLLTKRQRRKHEENVRNQVDPIELNMEKCSDRTPLLVNTMGWTTGLGSELLSKLRELLNPSTIYTFENQETSERDEENPRRIEFLEPIGDTPLSLRLPANESRTLNLISYLYATTLSSPISQTDRATKFFKKWSFENQLCKQRPFMIKYHEILIDLMDESIPNSHLSYVLNGSIVAICSSNGTNCLGLGLVRSIDPIQGILYLLLPAGLEDQKVRIVKGFEPCLPLDVLVYENGEQDVKPYLEVKSRVTGLLVGSEKKRVRRNVMRWSQRGN